MKILLICQYFEPERGAAANRVKAFAAHWSAAGADVQVITGLPNHPMGRPLPGHKPGVSSVETFKLIRSWLLPAPAGSFVKRTLGQVSFMVTATYAALRHADRPEVIVVSTPAFFSMFTGFLLRRLWRLPLVLDVRDLWPGFARSYEVFRHTWLLVPFEYLERWAYKNADLILTVSDGCAEQIFIATRDAPRVVVVPNGADSEVFRDSVDSVQLNLDVPSNKKLVCYLGNHGRVHDLPTLVKTASLLQDQEVHIVMVGEGPSKESAVAEAKALGASNMSWLEPVERNQVPAVLEQMDLCVSTVADVDALGSAIPAKIFDYFLARKPVVASATGEQARRVKELGGIVCDPGSAESLARAITEGLSSPRPQHDRANDALEKYDRRRLAAFALNEIATVRALS